MKVPPILLILMTQPGGAQAAPPVQSGEAVQLDKTLPASPSGTVAIENVSGSVRVEVSEKAEVTLHARIEGGADRLTFERDGDRVVVRVRSEDRAQKNGAELALVVPRGSHLDVRTVSADTSIRGVTGGLRLESVSGDLSLETVSGGIWVNSVSGDLRALGLAGDVQLKSVSGDADVALDVGVVRQEAVSGDLELRAKTLNGLRAHTVSGDIQVKAAIGERGNFDVESQSGDVRLEVPVATKAQLRLETFSGSIQSTLGGTGGVAHQRRGPGEKRELKLGAGGPDVSLSSFSGDVRVEAY